VISHTSPSPRELVSSWGLDFFDVELLQRAFIHSSYLHESLDENLQSNERLEFLGDSVLSLCVAEALMSLDNTLNEGELSRLRAYFVSEQSLAAQARRLGLGSYLSMGKGELMSGGTERSSILADLLEAFLGALYLDKGLETVREFILDKVFPDLSLSPQKWKDLQNTLLQKDSKSRLQELFQHQGWGTPRYVNIPIEGQNPSLGPFCMALYLGEEEIARAEAASKKEATQLLAQRLLAMDPQELVRSLTNKGFMTSGCGPSETIAASASREEKVL
jgi:ribonuclease III